MAIKKKRRKKSKIYFGTPAQEAIIEYNNCTDSNIRSKIYEDRIKYPFEKLAENVMNTFKFTYFDVPKIDVQTEVVSIMVQKMHMFQEGKGRAFSYFTIIAKNHLILKNNGNFKRWKQNNLLSQMPQTWNPENDFVKEQRDNEFNEFKNIMLKYWDENLNFVFTKKRDLQIADSILELFRRSEHIENFNKKHLYLLIREMTNCKTHYITKVVNVMKKHQKKLLNDFLEHGEIINKPKPRFWEEDEKDKDDTNPFIDNEYL
jgi:hypothetical protein